MFTIKPIANIRKKISLPPDKSISHRAIMLSSIASGKTSIKPFVLSEDTRATLQCIKKLRVKAILKNKNNLTIKGDGIYFSPKKRVMLSAGESGTTMRIMSGLLCAQKFPITFDAKPALRKRPMKRIISPLTLMGARITGRKKNSQQYPPLHILPAKKLNGIAYHLPIASAQVKSALLLASLYAKGKTKIHEPIISRDHTERMLKLFKAPLAKKGKVITLKGVRKLTTPRKIFVPGDFSSASFFIVLGLIARKSKLLVKNVNINPTRCGLLKVLKRMGANIKIINKKNYYEPYADILVTSSSLRATQVTEAEIPSMIDEIPILCSAASFAKGTTIIRGVKELKVKESDRLNAIIYNLKRAGIKIKTRQYKNKGKMDWCIEVSGTKAHQSSFKSFGDHRIAMSMIVLGLALDGKSQIDDVKCINKSFPEFISLIKSLA